MPPEIILYAALVAIVFAALCIIGCRAIDRSQRLRRAHARVGKARRQSQYPPDHFARPPESEFLSCFLRGYLQVPDTILGFNSQSGLTPADLSRLVTLWAAFGADANLCYGFINEHKRYPFRCNPDNYATLWIEFSHLGETWVYWYDHGALAVDFRRDFYRRDAATVLHDLRFGDVQDHLFKR